MVVVDYGVKKHILRSVAGLGRHVTVVPAGTSAGETLAREPDGIVLSNGPGDPAATGEYAVPVIRELVANAKPGAGICLGHQMPAIALGARVKMVNGHRGANHPIKNLEAGLVEITSQNHGVVVDGPASRPNVRPVRRSDAVVLLAPQFRDEHRSALDWLNSICAQDFGFFGVVNRWDGAERTACAVEYTSELTGKRLVLTGGFSLDLSSVPVENRTTASSGGDRRRGRGPRDARHLRQRRRQGVPQRHADAPHALPREHEERPATGGRRLEGGLGLRLRDQHRGVHALPRGVLPRLRFEGRQFEDVGRGGVNGVRYLRELSAAGEAGGGYVEYVFDNPAVHGDEETGSPKIAYATGFRMPNRDQVLVVASVLHPAPRDT